jgi:GGDEF domain-containing protein
MNIASDKATASLLRELRDRDTDTGLLTQSRIYRILLSETARSGRYGNPLSCILLRLEGLGAVAPHDRLALTSRLADVMRSTDYAGVWTDEEFLLVLPETDRDGAEGFALKLEQALNGLGVRLSANGGAKLSVATRVANWQTPDDADALLGRLSISYPS